MGVGERSVHDRLDDRSPAFRPRNGSAEALRPQNPDRGRHAAANIAAPRRARAAPFLVSAKSVSPNSKRPSREKATGHSSLSPRRLCLLYNPPPPSPFARDHEPHTITYRPIVALARSSIAACPCVHGFNVAVTWHPSVNMQGAAASHRARQRRTTRPRRRRLRRRRVVVSQLNKVGAGRASTPRSAT
jgi:hypothetical protein